MTADEQTLSTHDQVAEHAAGDTPQLLSEIRRIVAFGHLLYNLVYRDLTVRYKRSAIGFFWTMLNPLLLMLIFLAVFSHMFRFAVKHYEIYFLSEYIPWNFFAQTTVGAMTSMAWNGALMKKANVPKSIFALSNTISGMVNLLLSFVPMFLIMAFVHARFTAALLFLPVSVLILATFTLGVSLLLSAVSVYFIDVREMYSVAITGLMYLTPIVYPLSVLPDKYRWLIDSNPLAHLLQLLRAPIYEGVLPDSHTLLFSIISAVVSVLIGWSVFKRLANGFFVHL